LKGFFIIHETIIIYMKSSDLGTGTWSILPFDWWCSFYLFLYQLSSRCFRYFP